jgi:homeobox protein cut-like
MTATSKNIESIVKQWTTFDLKTIQHDLDVTTTEIASRADESDQSRRKLVELSRDFKKNTNEDVRKAVAPILKSFQIEIDSLSKRSKAAEKAYLEIYRSLSDLSDPVPALEYAQTLQKRAEKVSDLEVENQKLRETLDEYNHEFADVKNQEVTIKQLREKIKDLEDKTESTIQQRIKEKEKELQRIFGEKERQLQSNQFDLVTKYAEMEMRQKQLQQALDYAHQEMFEYKSKQEDAISARSSEIDILNQDLERANERASNAERIVDKLREQIDQNQQFMTSVSMNNNSDENISHEENQRKLREKLELELAAKEREIATLVIDTQKLQSTLMKVKETSVTQISDLENVLTAKEKFIAQLESKLHSQADYDEIKRELTILKSIEFPSTNRSNDEQTNNIPKKSLEILLLEKNRALQSEQTQIKVAHADLEKRFFELDKRCREFENANNELKQLNTQLEKDLLSVGGVTELFRRGPEGQTSDSSTNETGIIKDVLNQSSAPSMSLKDSSTHSQPKDSASDEALTAIVISQRERFRIRNVELENENVSLKQQIGIFQNEMDKLRSDNIKLYEKIKFVQAYPTTRGTDDSIDRYSRGYEASLDPFTNFTKQEKQKKYESLKLHEKFALNFGRFILSSHKSRTFFVIYFILVHILIFLSLYKMVHVGSSVRDMSQICFDKFREHMAGVHGEKDFHLEHAHQGVAGAPPPH